MIGLHDLGNQLTKVAREFFTTRDVNGLHINLVDAVEGVSTELSALVAHTQTIAAALTRIADAYEAPAEDETLDKEASRD